MIALIKRDSKCTVISKSHSFLTQIQFYQTNLEGEDIPQRYLLQPEFERHAC